MFLLFKRALLTSAIASSVQILILALSFPDATSSPAGFTLSIFLLVAFGTAIVFDARTAERRKTKSILWARLLAHYEHRHVTRVLSKAGLLCFSAIVIWPTLMLIWVGLLASDCALSLVVDRIAGHKPAEHIFSAIPRPAGTLEQITIASLFCEDPVTEPVMAANQTLTQNVLDVYGPASIQAAHLYLELGCGYRRVASQREAAPAAEETSHAQFEAAKQWCEKASEIFQSRGSKLECADALSNIADCQQHLGQPGASTESVAKASELLVQCPNCEDKISILRRLGWVSYLLQQQEKSVQFYAESHKIRLQFPRDSSTDATTYAQLVICTLALALVTFTAKIVLLRHCYSKWKRELDFQNDFGAQLKLLDKIITAELLMNRFDSAVLLSAEMIRVAGSPDIER